MSHRFMALLLIFGAIGLTSCEKDTGGALISTGDKQIRLKLPEAITFSGAVVVTSGQNNVYKFSIDYYSGVDSVIYTIWSSVPAAGNKCSIELFNITDNVPIPGSLIEATTNTEPVLYQSPNLKNNFPHKEITLGLRIKGDMNGQVVNATSGYLYLYRK